MRLREGKWLSKILWLVNAIGRPTPPLRFLTEGFCMTARAAICWESWSRMAEHFPHCPWMCKGNLFHLDKVQIKKQETKWGWGKGEGEHECEWVCVSVCVCVCVLQRGRCVNVQESYCHTTRLWGPYHWAYWSHQLRFPNLIPCRPATNKLHWFMKQTTLQLPEHI